MIDSTSGNQVVKALGDRLAGPEEKAKAAAVERASKVGSEEHQKAMRFLTEKMGQSLNTNQASAPSVEVASEETKKEVKRQNTARNENPKAGNMQSSASADPALTNPTTPTSPEVDIPTTLPLEPPKPPPPPPESIPDGFSLKSIGAKERSNHEEVLTRIMGMMSEMLSQSAEDQVEANRLQQAKRSELNLESIRTTEAEQIAEQKKADEAQKIASCVFQVVAVIVAIGFLVFSIVAKNPALIAISVLALGLVIADTALMAAGETTISEMVFGPIMEFIIQPIAQFFADIFTDILIAFGAEKNAAEIAGLVLGYIWAFSMIIVIVVAGRNSAILSAAMSKLASGFASVMGKMTPSMVQQFVAKITAAMGQAFAAVTTKMNFGGATAAARGAMTQAMAAGDTAADAAIKASLAATQAVARGLRVTQANMQIALHSASLGGGLAGGSAQVTGSVYQFNVNELVASLVSLLAAIQTNSEMLSELQDFFSGIMDRANELLQTAMDAQGAEQDAAKHIMDQMRRSL